MPNSSIAARLSALPLLQKPALSELWRELFETDPPTRMRKELLVRFVAYRMQQQEFRPLSDGSHRLLRELANIVEANSNTLGSRGTKIKPGTRLVREWKGEIHVVNAEQQSYEYRGTRYGSLSEIARLITGTRWSGPLFFGLKTTQKKGGRNDDSQS
jgi:hypothetical protein